MLLFAFGVTAVGPAAAQSYPNARPVKLVVPFPPGGPVDVSARILAQHLPRTLGQTVVVENRAGAAGSLGAKAVASADPDGYTLLCGNISTLVVVPAVTNNRDYDPGKAFAPVAKISQNYEVLVVNPAFPARSIAELVAHAKANPGKLNYGAGVASPPHIAWGLFNTVTGTDIVFIPYRGMAPAMSDLVSGQIQIMIDGTGPLLPHIREGKIRALAVTGKTRSPDFPDLPTMIESGYPDYVLSFWTGIVAPAGTPPDTVAKLNGAINEALKSPAMQAHLARFNVEANLASPQEFATFVATEAQKWSGIIKTAGIKAE
jgi:tripartite-type tricarboxylate transporter receptor subunit TctC